MRSQTSTAVLGIAALLAESTPILAHAATWSSSSPRAAESSTVTVLAVAPADRDPQAAEALSQQAGQAYDDDRLLEAAELLARAYALDPVPEYLYKRAHALREAGSCRAAISAFKAFIEATTSPDNHRVAREWIEHCEQELAEGEAGSRSDSELGPEPEPEPEPEPDADASPDRLRRASVGGMIAGGVVLVGGAALLGASYAAARTPEEETESDYEARERRTRALSVTGISLVTVGSVVLVAAGIGLGIARARSPERAVARRWRPAPGGVALRF